MLAIIFALSAAAVPMASQPCRACKIVDGKQICSNVAIACQPPEPKRNAEKASLDRREGRRKAR